MSTEHADIIPASGRTAIDASSTTLRFRDLAPSDHASQKAYFNNLSSVSRRARFMSAMPSMPEDLLDELSSIDGRQHVALTAETYVDGAYRMIAEARYVQGEDQSKTCEFAISVDDTWQGRGLGKRLLADLERKASSMGIETMVGETLYDNRIMTNLARRHGFEIGRNSRDASVLVLSKRLSPSPT